ncbi:MAG: YceH family protein [Gammaproteobacteria bacterium]
MLTTLEANEARVIGCLMEKSTVTPDQYPLTLNALTSACNQKSSRTPVMSLDPGVVKRTAHKLAGKHLLRIEENPRTGAEKYRQRFCNTTYSDLRFSPAEFAIVCLLLLRGPQTPGELRAHSGRLHTFADNHEVVDAANGLQEREGEPLIVRLPREAGRKDAAYAHLFFGPIDVEEMAAEARQAEPQPRRTAGNSDLADRVTILESEVAALRQAIAELNR